MTVHRTTPLPRLAARGRLLVSEAVLAPTKAALQAASTDGRPDEGMVLWLGRTDDDTSVVLGCSAPRTSSHWGRVAVDEASIGALASAARDHGLGVICQVHSHPGRDTRHSDGDDKLILMPFESMFSVVLGDYGTGSITPGEGGAGLHQYQDGRWIQVSNADAFAIVPALVTVLA
jgi:proteasome lid subunit RPN8/RPN11